MSDQQHSVNNEPNWHSILEFLEQTRIDGFVADPRHMVDNHQAPVREEISRLGVDFTDPDALYAFTSGLVELTRLRRDSWLAGLRSERYYADGVQDLFTCLVCIREFLPKKLFAKYFDPLLS